MQRSTAILCTAIAFTTPWAVAQQKTIASSFDGINAGININFGSASVDATSAAGTGLGKNSDSAQNLVLQIGRGLPFGSNGVANFGMSVGIGDFKSGLVGGQQFKQTQNVGLYGELGYVVDPKSMLYGKMSLNAMAGDLSGDGTVNFNGWGYGAGYRQILTQNIYLQGEMMQTTFGEASSPAGLKLKPSSTGLLLGVGYRF